MNHHIDLIKKNAGKMFAGRYTVSVMLEHRGKLLLVQEATKRIRGKWSQPAGHIEIGETPFQAAIRECREESGYRVKLTGITCIYFHPAKKDKNGYINYSFCARPIGKPSKKIAKEIMATKWFSKKELKKFPKELARNRLVFERIRAWLNGHEAIPLSYVREVK